MQQSCQLLVEAANVLIRRKPREVIHLLGHLAAEDFATKLYNVRESAPVVSVRHEDPNAAMDKAGTADCADGFIEMQDDASALARPELQLPDDFFTAMPLEDLANLLTKAKEYLDSTPAAAAGSSLEDRNSRTTASSTDFEKKLAGMLDSPVFKAAVVGSATGSSNEISIPLDHQQALLAVLRRFVLSAPIAKYLTMQLWRTIHRRNLRPPIFDFAAAKHEFEAMHKY
jgi:hypothetical protein